MALAITRFYVSINMVATDDNGKEVRRSKQVEIAASGVDDATKRSNATVQAEQIAGFFGAASNASVASIQITEVQEDAAVVIGAGNLFKEAVAVLALNATGSKKANLYIPAPNDALLTPSGSEIDSADLSWTNIESQFKSTKYCRLSDGETIRDTNPLLSSRVRVVRSGSGY